MDFVREYNYKNAEIEVVVEDDREECTNMALIRK